MKKYLMIFLLCGLILNFVGCNSIDNGKMNSIKFGKKSDNIQNSSVIAENEKYALKYIEKNKSIIFTDNNGDVLWNSSPYCGEETEYNEFGIPVKLHPQVNSAIYIQYLNSNTYLLEQAYSFNLSEENVNYKQIKNGICIEYYFKDIGILVPVDFLLREDSVSMSVDAKKIKEGSNKLITISFAPFSCSNKNDAIDSYIFYPSGSGAIVSNKSISKKGEIFSSEVYGRDMISILNDKITNVKDIRLPVYGVKNGDKAVCAIIEKGSESASIDLKVGSTALEYSSTYATYSVRGFSPNEVRFLNGGKRKMDVFSKPIVNNGMVIGFYPLKNDQASYSGMAQKYQNYIFEKSYRIKNDSNFGITFVGGTLIDKTFLGIPYKSLLVSTSFDDVGTILSDLRKSIDKRIDVKLIGFGKDGLDSKEYAGGFIFDSKFGRKKDLENLTNQIKNCNTNLYFDFDLIRIYKNSIGYSTLFSTAHNSLGKIAEGFSYNVATRSRDINSKYTFLKRKILKESGVLLNKKIKNSGITGVSLESLSQFSYSDYSEKSDNNSYLSKANMAADVSRIFKDISKQRIIASSDANVYAAINSDIIFNAPTFSSQQRIFLYDVPFYALVFKGYLPINCESINCADDYNVQLLKSIESGSGLHYTLIKKYNTKFINYNGNYFFASEYSSAKSKLLNDYERTKEYYSFIDGATIISHSVINEDVRITEFDNGVKVCVNYSDSSVNTEMGDVKPLDFIWTR